MAVSGPVAGQPSGSPRRSAAGRTHSPHRQSLRQRLGRLGRCSNLPPQPCESGLRTRSRRHQATCDGLSCDDGGTRRHLTTALGAICRASCRAKSGRFTSSSCGRSCAVVGARWFIRIQRLGDRVDPMARFRIREADHHDVEHPGLLRDRRLNLSALPSPETDPTRLGGRPDRS